MRWAKGVTGVRLFLQAGKFFERAPDEMPYACYWGSKMATNNQEECTRLRLFWRLFFPCYGPVTAPVIRLFFFEKCRFMGFSGRAAIKFPVLYRDEAKNARDAKGSCIFANWRVEKGYRPAPARRQNEPEDSSVMAVVK